MGGSCFAWLVIGICKEWLPSTSMGRMGSSGSRSAIRGTRSMRVGGSCSRRERDNRGRGRMSGVPEFASWSSYWDFSYNVQLRTRFIFDQGTRDFLDCIIATSTSRAFRMAEGATLWRAQLHDPTLKRSLKPFPFERMKPLLNCSEGRLNPKNIPCLYLASDEHTAMSEVRPWVGSLGTLAEFRTTKDLRLVNCAEKLDARPLLGWLTGKEEPRPEERERHVWAVLNNSFSEPVSSTDTTARYAPTQILAETFRSAGFDGVMYNSSVAGGMNVALFDLASADPIDRDVFQARRPNYEFDRVRDTLFREVGEGNG